MLALSDGATSWGSTEYLLAAAVDALNAANWQRGSGKGRRPKPIPRPGADNSGDEQIGGNTTYTVDEMRELLAPNRDPD